MHHKLSGGWASLLSQTSMAMVQSRPMQAAMASNEPLIVTVLSVEAGNISLSTWINAPVDYNNNNKYYYNRKDKNNSHYYKTCLKLI